MVSEGLNMENNRLGNLKRWTIKDLEMSDSDLQAIMTLGLTVSGTFLNLLKLKKELDNIPEIRVIFNTISPVKLRVVKHDQYEEFLAWRERKNLPRFENP